MCHLWRTIVHRIALQEVYLSTQRLEGSRAKSSLILMVQNLKTAQSQYFGQKVVYFKGVTKRISLQVISAHSVLICLKGCCICSNLAWTFCRYQRSNFGPFCLGNWSGQPVHWAFNSHLWFIKNGERALKQIVVCKVYIYIYYINKYMSVFVECIERGIKQRCFANVQFPTGKIYKQSKPSRFPLNKSHALDIIFLPFWLLTIEIRKQWTCNILHICHPPNPPPTPQKKRTVNPCYPLKNCRFSALKPGRCW